MTNIIRTNDLSNRVEVVYDDETGLLGHTFNLMIAELEGAYASIKRYALRAVIEQIVANPEEMLTGRSRVLAILISDTRSFTTIQKGLRPAWVSTRSNGN